MLRRTLATVESALVAMGMAGSCSSLYLLLGATGVGKSLLVKRLQTELQRWGQGPWRTTSYFANAMVGKNSGGRLTIHEKGKKNPRVMAKNLQINVALSVVSAHEIIIQKILNKSDVRRRILLVDCCLFQVGTNLTDLSIGKKITVRELGGCMGPIWSSYYSDCHAVLYMIDAANPTQISASCVQLLSLLSAEQLTSVPVLLIFNKIDLPCYMSLVEMKSLFRIQDIIACAKQVITVVEISARDGRGLSDVMKWLQSTLHD